MLHPLDIDGPTVLLLRLNQLARYRGSSLTDLVDTSYEYAHIEEVLHGDARTNMPFVCVLVDRMNVDVMVAAWLRRVGPVLLDEFLHMEQDLEAIAGQAVITPHGLNWAFGSRIYATTLLSSTVALDVQLAQQLRDGSRTIRSSQDHCWVVAQALKTRSEIGALSRSVLSSWR